MRSVALTPIALLISLAAYSQFNQKYTRAPDLPGKMDFLNPSEPVKTVEESWLNSILKADGSSTHRLSSPFVATRAQSNFLPQDMYWTGSITTQSFNRGKLGTYYYWDIQGNLRETRMFLDIAGKNKRGLKLVFPRR